LTYRRDRYARPATETHRGVRSSISFVEWVGPIERADHEQSETLSIVVDLSGLAIHSLDAGLRESVAQSGERAK